MSLLKTRLKGLGGLFYDDIQGSLLIYNGFNVSLDFTESLLMKRDEMTYASNIIPEQYQEVAQRIRTGWTADTSAYEGWVNEGVPAESGQCAITALFIQEIYGGVLKRALVNGESHYWNEINDETVDLTRAQFASPLVFEEETEREKEYVLSFPTTQERYSKMVRNINGID